MISLNSAIIVPPPLLASVSLDASKSVFVHSETSCRAIAETATDAIIVADEGERICLWNRSAANIFGYEAEEVLGQSVQLLMDERFRGAHAEKFEKAVQSGSSSLIGTTRELIAKRKDGTEFPIELALSSWEEGGKIFFSAIIRDISERKKTEQEMQAKSIAAKAHEETHNTIRSMLHEINNPLSAIITNLFILRERKALEGENKQMLDEVFHLAQLVARISDNMRKFSVGSRIPNDLSVQDFDLENMLDMIIKMTKRMNPLSEFQLALEIEPDVPTALLGFDELLEQILISLLSNAIKYAPTGQITVKVKQSPEPELGDDVRLLFSISDTGTGFLEGEAEIIFQPLVRGGLAKESSEGDGLGLAIVKRLLIPLQGEIWAESAGPGKGATFHFTALFAKSQTE